MPSQWLQRVPSPQTGAGQQCDPSTGVPYPHEDASPQDAAVGLCLGSQGGPRGVGGFYERGTPVGYIWSLNLKPLYICAVLPHPASERVMGPVEHQAG